MGNTPFPPLTASENIPAEVLLSWEFQVAQLEEKTGLAESLLRSTEERLQQTDAAVDVLVLSASGVPSTSPLQLSVLADEQILNFSAEPLEPSSHGLYQRRRNDFKRRQLRADAGLP